MKRVLFLLLLSVIGCSTYNAGTPLAQAPEPQIRVIDVPNQSKSDLYLMVNSWFVETFSSSESVIEFRDKEAGRIMGKYVDQVSDGSYAYYIKSTITVDVKEGKVRVTMSNPKIRIYANKFGYTTGTQNDYYPVSTVEHFQMVIVKWALLADDLDAYLEKKNIDW